MSGQQQVFDAEHHEILHPGTDSWHDLPVPHGGLFFGMPLYAHLFLLRNGLVFFFGGRMDDPNPPEPVLMDLTTNPVTITGVPGLDDPATRDQSASVLLPPAQHQRVMVLGGGPADASNATGSTAIVDLTGPGPVYAPAAPMSLPRMHLNAVLLPDHTVFVSGGALSREDRTVARLQSEIYDPANNTWRIGATATVVRMYTRSPCCSPTAGSSPQAATPLPTATRSRGSRRTPTRKCGWRSTARPTCSPARARSSVPPRPSGNTASTSRSAARRPGTSMGQHHPPRRHHPLLRQLPAARGPGHQRPGAGSQISADAPPHATLARGGG